MRRRAAWRLFSTTLACFGLAIADGIEFANHGLAGAVVQFGGIRSAPGDAYHRENAEQQALHHGPAPHAMQRIALAAELPAAISEPVLGIEHLIRLGTMRAP